MSTRSAGFQGSTVATGTRRVSPVQSPRVVQRTSTPSEPQALPLRSLEADFRRFELGEYQDTGVGVWAARQALFCRGQRGATFSTTGPFPSQLRPSGALRGVSLAELGVYRAYRPITRIIAFAPGTEARRHAEPPSPTGDDRSGRNGPGPRSDERLGIVGIQHRDDVLGCHKRRSTGLFERDEQGMCLSHGPTVPLPGGFEPPSARGLGHGCPRRPWSLRPRLDEAMDATVCDGATGCYPKARRRRCLVNRDNLRGQASASHLTVSDVERHGLGQPRPRPTGGNE